MKHLILTIYLSCLIIVSHSDPLHKAFNSYREQILDNARKLSKAFTSRDYNTIADYTYPGILELVGGKVEMLKKLESDTKEMEAKGVKVISVTIGEPSDIYETEKEIQCILPQIITMEVPKGTMEAKSTLIAISSDNGKTWYFIDTSGNDIETIRKMLPNVSPEINLPPKEQPVLYLKKQE